MPNLLRFLHVHYPAPPSGHRSKPHPDPQYPRVLCEGCCIAMCMLLGSLLPLSAKANSPAARQPEHGALRACSMTILRVAKSSVKTSASCVFGFPKGWTFGFRSELGPAVSAKSSTRPVVWLFCGCRTEAECREAHPCPCSAWSRSLFAGSSKSSLLRLVD